MNENCRTGVQHLGKKDKNIIPTYLFHNLEANPKSKKDSKPRYNLVKLLVIWATGKVV
jgi:hypothetical protein